jgi:hypothetical protein
MLLVAVPVDFGEALARLWPRVLARNRSEVRVGVSFGKSAPFAKGAKSCGARKVGSNLYPKSAVISSARAMMVEIERGGVSRVKSRRRLLTWISLATVVCAIAIWLALAFMGVLDSGKFENAQSQTVSQNHIAMLARRSDSTALSGDRYFVVIGSHLYTSSELKRAFYSSRPVFVAGREGLDIYSVASNVLTIECKDCGVSKDLVEKQRFSDDSIVIRYVGFP